MWEKEAVTVREFGCIGQGAGVVTDSTLSSCLDSTHLRSAPKGIEHIEENKAGECHCGVSWCDLVILHLSAST